MMPERTYRWAEALDRGSTRLLTAGLLALGVGGAALAGNTNSDTGSIRADMRCLALNIYFEARGEPDRGKIAVGHVVMNRVEADRFPDTICAVVKQGGEDTRHMCQFSWWCDGRSDTPRDADAWRHSKALAHQVFWGLAEDPTLGALWYHAKYVSPPWRTRFIRVTEIGEHVFYLPVRKLATTREPRPVVHVE